MHGDKCLSMEEVAAMGEAIAETAAIIDVATHRFLSQLREFDRVDGWHRAGALSCAHWLSWRVGMDLGAAREKVRVARKLAELPDIDEALRKGEISYSKVRAMTRVATPANEHDLLSMARCAAGAQLDKICRLKRMVNGLEGADEREVESRRYVVERPTEDGMVSIQLRLLEDESGRTIDVGRKTRTIPAALRRALASRDDGGETSLENTVLLCRRHHRALHEHGFSLERVGEELVFRDPRGNEVPAQGPKREVIVDLPALACRWRGAPVRSEVNAPGWDGQPVDYDLCVAALA